MVVGGAVPGPGIKWIYAVCSKCPRIITSHGNRLTVSVFVFKFSARPLLLLLASLDLQAPVVRQACKRFCRPTSFSFGAALRGGGWGGGRGGRPRAEQLCPQSPASKYSRRKRVVAQTGSRLLAIYTAASHRYHHNLDNPPVVCVCVCVCVVRPRTHARTS
jgi:hypothetical protein